MGVEELKLFESDDGSISLPVQIEEDTVWLTQAQMVELFEKDQSVISRHINNAFKEGEVDRKSNMQNLHIPSSDRPVALYNLDVIISVGYRVKSQRGVEFRRWATGVLRKYIIEGQAVNARRLEQLADVAHVMARIPDSLETRQVLDIVRSYTVALDLLDDYDHQRISLPQGSRDVRVLSYEECRGVIDGMRFGDESDLFGVEKDDSFKGTIGSIYQSFGGQEIYPSLQEKAANLLYLVVKNHSFLDGNKRIAATMFLYFLDCNKSLFTKSGKIIEDSTLVAVTIMIAESKPEEKDAMVALVMNFLALD
ncbi:virulence protein RhuM/Fic/DOC family protein [Paraeggerthella sp. Marseille-Q4926]|uniref:virulence protein RhuM/Fic/DOC family protein n=1 Tax=Paraeggerthella sp. Marseille-Q4926 TaxID=2866587 RepID=UPI001CE3C8E8|nr:virulence protein RhuM/Fic/DOC family protein [Paraeggerthella sp. Marseille-Q4926]